MLIYKITNIINKKVYIGQTIVGLLERKRSHLCGLRNNKHKNKKLQNAVNKYGIENFIFEEIDIASNIDELNKKESFWISFYDSINNGYNIMGGGQDRTIYPNTIEKLRISKLGKNNPMYGISLSTETKKLMSDAHKGLIPWNKGTTGLYTRSTETKDKIRKHKIGKLNPRYGKPAINKGITPSDEIIKKMSKLWKFLSPSGDVIEFINLEKFCREHSLITSCMHAVYTGKRSHHKGWKRV